MEVEIIKAEKKHIKDVSILFNLYRQFYKYKEDIKNSEYYIRSRIINNESIIFIATNNEKVFGFVQLYENFDSLNLNKKLVLYDLYILAKYRELGIGSKLMNKSKDFAINNNFKRIELSTAIDNSKAQKLYESLDYIRDKEYYNYDLDIKK
jgi:ribosomal protein S18 acetylase RimI-like enzyme